MPAQKNWAGGRARSDSAVDRAHTCWTIAEGGTSMARRPLERRGSHALRIGSLMLTVAPALAAAAWQDLSALTDTAPLVYGADVDSIIHPVSAEYMIATMDLADRNGAALIVFTLRTPGGLLDSTRSIVSRMIAAKTPVAVFVAPAGARAASAGFFLTIAADID